METFDYDLFHSLFENLFAFVDYIGGRSTEGASITDINSEDITGCLELSIFPQLGIIKRGSEMHIHDYVRIEEKDRVIGLKGVFVSFLEEGDISSNSYFYEFAHMDNDGDPNEYVKKFNIDEVVVELLREQDNSPGSVNKGSDYGKNLIQASIDRSSEFPDSDRDQLKYRCLVEGKGFDIWKVGFHDGPFQLVMTDSNQIGLLNDDMIVNHYLRGTSLTKFNVEALSSTESAQFSIEPNNFRWYNYGSIDIDPDLTKKNRRR